MSEKILNSIDKKMTLMLKLLALNIVADKKSSEQIMLLHNAGMAPKDIAKVLNKTRSNVNSTLYNIRKSKKEANDDSTIDDAHEE